MNITKICNQCNTLKKEEDFYKRKGNKIYSYCKECCKKRVRNQNYNFKQKCLEYKNTKACLNCGYNKNPAALDFHHLESEQKEFEITRSKTYGSVELHLTIKQELDKCIVLCANCHRELHNGSLKYKDNIFYETEPEHFEWVLKKDKPTKTKKENKPRQIKYKIEWPSNEEISRLVWEKPLSKIAEDLGVSDKAIAKFCQRNNIEKPSRVYWLKVFNQ